MSYNVGKISPNRFETLSLPNVNRHISVGIFFIFLHFILRRAITFHCPVFREISPAIALVILARVPPSSIILFNFFSFPLNNNKCNNELALLSSCMWMLLLLLLPREWDHQIHSSCLLLFKYNSNRLAAALLYS